jgi:DNA modification methylase
MAEIKKIKDLTPDHKNANKGTRRGSEMVEDSLRKYGAGRSILIDKHGRIIAGNKTVEQAGQIGLEDVIVVRTDGSKIVAVQRTDLDLEADPKAKELAIADNRAGQVSLDWDGDVLEELAREIDITPFFTKEELEALIPQRDGGILEDVDEDAVPELPAEPITKPGDLWVMGRHRLLCGDSTNAQHIDRLMRGETAHLCLTDPPYGLGDTSSVKNNYDTYEDSHENLIETILGFLPIAQQISSCVVLTPGNGNAYLYPAPTWTMAWFTPAGVGRGPWGFCCWQPILCYGKDPKLAKGKGCHPDAIVHTESAEKLGHPCTKPINFWKWLMERTSESGELIYEPFSGSGTTFIAAEALGRTCYGLELSPQYCDVIVKRWETATGQKAGLNGEAA